MNWTIKYTPTAAKAIRKLDSGTQSKVYAALEMIRENPDRGKPLQLTLKGLRSWRTSDWRIIYKTFENYLEILIVAVGHRREIYDRLKERLK